MSIATIGIKVIADAKGVGEGLQKGAAEVDKFAGHARESFEKLALLGGVALGGLGSFEAFKARREELIETSKAADKLGLSMRDFQKLSVAAEGADVTHGIGIMARTLTDAEIGANGAKEKLALFGMKAEEFKGLSIDQAVGKLGDRFKTITDPMEKAKFAMTFFGRGGMEMFELLEKGSDGLAEAGAKVDQFGTALNAVQSSNLRESQHALRDLQMQAKGLGNQLVGNTSPAIESFAQSITRLGQSNWFKDKLFGFSMGLARIADSISGKDAFAPDSAMMKTFAGAHPEAALAKGVKTKEAPGAGVGIELTPEMEKEQKALDKLIDSIDIKNQHVGAGANEMRVYAAAVEATDMAQEEFDALLAKAKETDLAVEVDRLTKSFEKETEALKLSANQARVAELAHKGLKGQALENARAAAASADAAKLEKETETPLEKFRSEIDKLGGMNLGDELFGKGVQKAAKDLQGALGLNQTVSSPHLALAGSAEAMSLISQFDNRTQKEDVGENLKELIRVAQEQDRHQQTLLEKILAQLQQHPELITV